MRAPRPASSAIVVRNGRFLLVQRSNPPAADLYAFPGGKAEPGESPQEAALRELREETGLIGHNPELFATYELLPEPEGPPHHHFLLSVFLVRVESTGGEAVAASDAGSLGWFTLEEVRRLPVPDSVLECCERLDQVSTAG
ncbi:NUDIX hydrolase [Rhizobium paknamense]|uniref:ADP-ribose pyrophosphatase YjhB (NUDIX family) n=1 Tax=Rhizobium paknamense TaxID=1206817 RepID=A0ABU0I7I2_9HYPH|nr:NUDIX hydrolase [Rhizobium paknamense]MDQ0454183.1 ADP-ribose pyrophosphatase YjhB (NUDIX family) [Rhizobium paknamense]